ncbi:MAG: hypothetical protein D6775_06600, partial [Caldilineae bacterium]
ACDVPLAQQSPAAGQTLAAVDFDRVGNAFAVWNDNRTGNNSIYGALFTRLSSQWHGDVSIPGSSLPAASAPAVAFGPVGETIAVWAAVNGGDSDIWAALRPATDGTWFAPVQVNDDSAPPAVQERPDVVITRGGDTYVVWEDSRLGDPDIFWTRRQRGNPAWEPARRLHPTSTGIQLQPAIVADGLGNVHVVWVDRRGVQSLVMIAHLRSGSSTWSPPEPVGGSLPPSAHPANPSLAIDRSGNMIVAWEDNRQAATAPDIFFSRREAVPGSTWSAPVPLHDVAAGAQRWPALAAFDTVVAAWEDARLGDSDIYQAWLKPDGSGWETNRRINRDAPGAVQSHPDIALDPDGNAVIVWTDARNAGLAPDVYVCYRRGLERYPLYQPLILR